jgi:hypothetical protein
MRNVHKEKRVERRRFLKRTASAVVVAAAAAGGYYALTTPGAPAPTTTVPPITLTPGITSRLIRLFASVLSDGAVLKLIQEGYHDLGYCPDRSESSLFGSEFFFRGRLVIRSIVFRIVPNTGNRY